MHYCRQFFSQTGASEVRDQTSYMFTNVPVEQALELIRDCWNVLREDVKEMSVKQHGMVTMSATIDLGGVLGDTEHTFFRREVTEGRLQKWGHFIKSFK